jgi:hypothetical protein
LRDGAVVVAGPALGGRRAEALTKTGNSPTPSRSIAGTDGRLIGLPAVTDARLLLTVR